MLFSIIFNPFVSAIINGFFGRFLGHFGTRIFSTFLLLINFVLAIFCFLKIYNTAEIYTLNLGTWISSGLFSVEWSFVIDDLTIIMLIVVNLIAFLVHLYSTKYMDIDAHVSRFMSYLSLFTFFMLILITADNYIQLFLGWEGVGLCSYLLISFWYTRIQANKSALKAIIVNRISDFCLTLGIIMIFYFLLTIDFNSSFALSKFLVYFTITSNWFFSEIYILTIITFLLFLGAVGKSAQVLLHTWLPDAMEGPTPVSALIHAATMVTAGVFLLIKCSVMLEYSSTTLFLIIFFGAITSIFAATSGLILSDIKKVIAYSTCSQLGYMVFACGFSAYNVSLFHLMNHAIFKALLFLCAGAVIHSVGNEQDMRRMGGLVKLLPLSYSSILIASLAITGFPFLTGFFSKDIILETTAGVYGTSGLFIHWIASLTAFFTAVYSIRLLYLVFLSSPNILRSYVLNIHESSVQMGFPLILLAFGSIFIGFLFKDLMIGPGNLFLSSIIILNPTFLNLNDAEFLIIFIKLIPLFVTIFGFFFFIIFLNIWRNNLFFYKKFYFMLLNFLFSKWQFDRIYNIYINMFFLKISKQWTYKLIDKGLLEILGPFGFWKILKFIGFKLTQLNTGFLGNYLFFMFFFTLVFIYLLNGDFLSTFNFSFFIFFTRIFEIKTNILAWVKINWDNFYNAWLYFKVKQRYLFFKEQRLTYRFYHRHGFLLVIEEWNWLQLLLNDDESDFTEEFHPLWYWTDHISYVELNIKAFRHFIKKYWPSIYWILYLNVCFWFPFIFSLIADTGYSLFGKDIIFSISFIIWTDLMKVFPVLSLEDSWFIRLSMLTLYIMLFEYFMRIWYYCVEIFGTFFSKFLSFLSNKWTPLKDKKKITYFLPWIWLLTEFIVTIINGCFIILFFLYVMGWMWICFQSLGLDMILPYLKSYDLVIFHEEDLIDKNCDYYTYKCLYFDINKWQAISPLRHFYTEPAVIAP